LRKLKRQQPLILEIFIPRKEKTTKILVSSLLSTFHTLIKEEDNTELNKEVTVEEVKDVINQFDPDKAPGPDGFTLHFYRNCWTIIKTDLICMIRYVQKSLQDGRHHQLFFSSLIPKDKKHLFL
jgi:hypothetical protein